MSPANQSISQIRRNLSFELNELLPGNEAVSVTGLILEHLGYPSDLILRDPDKKPEDELRSEITKIVNELKKNKPIQYILGKAYFTGLVFEVNHNVLIPRQETEELVHMISIENRHKNPNILDIGTGSGCIAVALAGIIPGSQISAIDISEDACQIAERNAQRNGVKIDVLCLDMFNYESHLLDRTFEIIVSNPPYVTLSEKELMAFNVTGFEPGSALYVTDEDPLIYYRQIIAMSENLLAERGVIWVEINENFGKETASLFVSAGFHEVRILKDIHGKERFIKASRK